MNYHEFNTPASSHCDQLAGDYKLTNHGLTNLGRVYWNLPTSALIEEAVFRGEVHLVKGGAIAVNTGKWTARAAKDKYIVSEDSSKDKVWWDNNQAYNRDDFDKLFSKVQAYLQGKELFVQDVYVGADSEYSLPIRVITEAAWQSHFARNMFLTIKDNEKLKKHIPEFTLISVPSFHCVPELDNTRTETAIILNFEKKIALVIGSHYSGEIKKSFFTIMNYLKPLEGVMTMHCSANVGKEGDVALFFGLSGTGKTTLSADPNRFLIGDDEHGWSDNGVFNFEGGCYAKVIRLSKENEPEIYECTHKFGTILENVVFDETTRVIDLNDDKYTENTRASYPLDFIPNALPEKMSHTQPKNIIFLTCDATGVIPPVSKLDQNQAMYHFISGYTSKIAGTEIGLGTEPQLAFSACFGAPFLVHHPYYYANLLKEKMDKYGANCWLVNTGWVGGKFGVGNRISIKHTRNILNAILNGNLENVEFKTDKLFGFQIPLTCPNVPDEVLIPENSWSNKDEYWDNYDGLAAKYIANFKKFENGVNDNVKNAGPKRLS